MKKFPDVKKRLLAEAIKRNREMRKIMALYIKQDEVKDTLVQLQQSSEMNQQNKGAIGINLLT